MCKLWEGLNVAIQRMEASIEELKGQLRVERERRMELQTPLGEARERAEATGNLVEKTEDDLREKRERRVEIEELVKALMALDPVPSDVRGKESCFCSISSTDSCEKSTLLLVRRC
ncbi:hypothetical protein MTO96_028841 [Rhipicephalus appendiculatus]